MKVLHFSPHCEDCGIAKYSENYLAALEKDGVEGEFFEFSPYQTREMDDHVFHNEVVKKLVGVLKDYDILHIQHEFGFFRGEQLKELVSSAKNLGKKVVVTYHTSPDLIIIPKPLKGMGPRSILAYLKGKRHNKALTKIHIEPLLLSDKVLVHNEYTRGQLEKYGVPSNKLYVLPHPTPPIVKNYLKTDFIAKKLQKKEGDVIIGNFGYIHRFKGVDAAIKALSFLPENYKLAIIGSAKADSNEIKFYDKLCDMIVSLGLKDRVYIAGTLPTQELIDAYIHECDFFVFPYDEKYYKGVSSGALNVVISNEKPIIAYPVNTFRETNTYGQLIFTYSGNYYELVREIEQINIRQQTEKIREYAADNSWDRLAVQLAELYKRI